MIAFALGFTMGKAHSWGMSPKREAKFNYYFILDLLWECPTFGAYLTLKKLVNMFCFFFFKGNYMKVYLTQFVSALLMGSITFVKL
jgi:hypothetical protein